MSATYLQYICIVQKQGRHPLHPQTHSSLCTETDPVDSFGHAKQNPFQTNLWSLGRELSNNTSYFFLNLWKYYSTSCFLVKSQRKAGTFAIPLCPWSSCSGIFPKLTEQRGSCERQVQLHINWMQYLPSLQWYNMYQIMFLLWSTVILRFSHAE